MITPARDCIFCGTRVPVSPGVRLPHTARAVCESPACRWKWQATPVASRCRVCDTPLTITQLARGTCGHRSCELNWHVDRPIAFRHEERRRLERDATLWRDEAGPLRRITNASAFRVVVVPDNDAPSVPLLARRRRYFAEHLRKVAHRVMQDDGSPDTVSPRSVSNHIDPPSADVARALIGACIACRGYCCRTGGEHAYITVDTARRWFTEHPGATIDDFVADYTTHLPERVLGDGCVFQHRNGCTLPREQRSDTCNRFFCAPLRELVQEHRQAGAPDEDVRAFFVPVRDGVVQRAAFSTTSFVQLVRRTPKTAASLPGVGGLW